jgi:hypothetical protein
VISLTCYRLCVLASGSLITDILSCFTLIMVSCLHLGQNSGKFSSTVSTPILTFVLLPQTGHNIHSYLHTRPSPYLMFLLTNFDVTGRFSEKAPAPISLLLCFIRNLFHSLVNFLVRRFLIDVSVSF